jgi:hypothetical protein
MAIKYLYTLSKAGQSYYGPSLQANNLRQKTTYSQGEQPPVISNTESTINLSKFAAVVGTAAAIGNLPYKGGNIWDKYTNAMRMAEEYSPAGILKTFQLSNIFSSYESSVRNANLFISPAQLASNKRYASYLSQLIGETAENPVYSRLLQEGVTLRKSRLFYGQGNEVALRYASALRSSGINRIGEAYARSINFNGDRLHTFFGSIEPSPGVLNPEIGGFAAQIIGGHTKGQAAYRKVSAIGTELVERFNRLLDIPIESRPMSDVFEVLQNKLQQTFGRKLYFGVEKTGGLRMLGSLSAKYGLGLTAAILGYQTLDYEVRNSKLFNNTAFNNGLTSGIATIGINTNIQLAKFSEATGLSRYREKQEEIAPGSTSLQKLLGFPLIGATTVGIGGYAYRVGKMAQLQRSGMEVTAARKATDLLMNNWGSFGLEALGKNLTRKEGLWARDDLLGKIIQGIARPNKEGELVYKFLGKLTPMKTAALAAGATGFALVAPFLPGALLPSKSSKELEDIYSGKQEVAIRKGRWWSFGRSPYEGDKVIAHIPHWYARMQQRGREKTIWNEQEGKELTPFQKFWKREFTYELEQQHYKDRPYPITSLPFEDVPLVGPVLANTLGRLIKPPMLMHTDEWMDKEGNTITPGMRKGERIATEIGQLPPGSPANPYSIKATINRQVSHFEEMIGLPGFAIKSIKEKITGTSGVFEEPVELESARRIAGTERNYWERELGDIGGTNEALRRLFPHRDRNVQLYNPIKNEMPSWIPGAGDKSIDFSAGDPYSKIPFGEIRLPGRGYEERNPELKGVNPEDYPLAYQMKILADIAPYSDKLKQISGRARAKRASSNWTQEEENIYDQAVQQLREKKEGQKFSQYQYLSRGHAEESTDIQAAINRDKTSREEKPSLFRKLFGGYWELLSHNAETEVDQLTPISPGAKLIHERTPIEAYERQQFYGTRNAFWQHPVRDFIAPFSRIVGRALGYEGTPSHLQDVRNINEYFDILKYVKNTRLAGIARANKDFKAASEFDTKRHQTLFGMNPFSMNFTNIFNALPRSERDYYNDFSQASTMEERAKILNMVPENEKALYIARWKLAHVADIKQAEKRGILSEDQIKEADAEINKTYDEARNEGYDSNKELQAEYIKTRQRGESYGDWYRRTKLLTSVPLPGADWVGWHPSVELEDIKLKTVSTLGEDMHDFDLWPSREAQLSQKPYINNEAIAPLLSQNEMSESEIRSRVNELIGNRGSTFIHRSNGSPQTTVTIEEDRRQETHNILRKALG